jgi:histidinol-phosphate aminotransferase
MIRIRKSLQSIAPYSAGERVPGAVKLSSNENPLGSSPAALERISECSADIRYYPDGGARALKTKIAERCGIGAENVLVGNGSDELLVMIAAACIEPGSEGITAEHTFSEYTFAVKLFGGSMRYAPMSGGTFDLDAVARQCGERTRAVFICNPNNPTGTYLPHTALEEFIRAVPADVLIVIDEAYHDFSVSPDFPSGTELIKKYDNCICLRTFSKIYGLAGLRIGYAIGDAGLISELHRAKQPFNVNTLAQEAAAAALDDEEFYTRSRYNNEEGKTYLYAELRESGIEFYPTEANFICINTKRDCFSVSERIKQAGITIRPLASFGMQTWVRYTIGLPEHNTLFVRELKKTLCT